MRDKYVEVIVEKINFALLDENYSLAGQNLYELTKYGIIIGDETLVFLASELSDVFRNSFLRIKEFEKNLDKTIITDILLKVRKILDIIADREENLDSETKIKIFDGLTFIISNAERIQAKTRELENSKSIKRRRLQSGIL